MSGCCCLNLNYPIITQRVTNDYLEVGTGTLFVAGALMGTVMENLAGFLIKEYTQESWIRAINFFGWCAMFASGLMIMGALLSRRPFVGYKKKEKQAEK